MCKECQSTLTDMTTTRELALLTDLSKQLAAIAGASHGVDLLRAGWP